MLRVTAEFVVIVVGVLVAFAVDDWATDRAERAEARRYIERLAVEVRNDSAVYETFFLPALARSDSVLLDVRAVAMGRASVPRDTVSFLVDLAATSATPLLSTIGSTYDEMLATGSLNVLEPPELRSAIVAYYSAVNLAKVTSESRESAYPAFVRSYLPDARAAYADNPASLETTLRSYGLRQAVEMVGTRAFLDALNQHAAYISVMRPTVLLLQADAHDLIRRLDEAGR